MRVKSLTICQTCLVDSQSNNISFINLIEEIQAISLPITIPQVTAVIIVERDSETENETELVELKASINGDDILLQTINTDFKGKLRNRLILVLPGFPIKNTGVLKFVVRYNNQDVIEESININTPKR